MAPWKINQIRVSFGGIYVNLDFDFCRHYVVSFATTALFAVIVFIIYQVLELPLLSTVIVFSIIPIIALVGVGYSVSNTRRRITQEFSMFMQSFASKKD